MVLYKNATIQVPTVTTTIDDCGDTVREADYTTPLESFRADVQPANLTEAQLQQYGITEGGASARKCFCEIGDGSFLKPLSRVKVIDDLLGEYECYAHPVNVWRNHREFILTAIENE